MTNEIKTTAGKTYAKRFNAQRAAKSVFPGSADGESFETFKAANGEWAWREIAFNVQLNAIEATSPTLPTPPDFSANTHKAWRKRHAALVALAESGDIDGLRAFHLPDYSSSPKALNRYRNAAIAALTGGK